MPTLTFPHQVGSLQDWFMTNELPIYRQWVQESIAGLPKHHADNVLDEIMAGGHQDQFKSWLEVNHPAELEMYNIVRFR